MNTEQIESTPEDFSVIKERLIQSLDCIEAFDSQDCPSADLMVRIIEHESFMRDNAAKVDEYEEGCALAGYPTRAIRKVRRELAFRARFCRIYLSSLN